MMTEPPFELLVLRQTSVAMRYRNAYAALLSEAVLNPARPNPHPIIAIRAKGHGQIWPLLRYRCADIGRVRDFGWIAANENLQAIAGPFDHLCQLANTTAWEEGGMTIAEATPFGPILWDAGDPTLAVLVAFEKPSGHELLAEMDGFSRRRNEIGHGYRTVGSATDLTMAEREAWKLLKAAT